MQLTARETRLCKTLGSFPYDNGLRYTSEANLALQKTLFRSLAAENDEYLRILFHNKLPRSGEEWSLSKAQGMAEDMEYTEAARGKACGHIFKAADSVFRCKTCTTDDTAVLCTRCFEASDHTGHIVNQSISLGNSGCCDCGDAEAWRIPVECAIHTAHESKGAGKRAEAPSLPDDLVECIRMTIGRALDYMIDVLACSPENLRLPKTAENIEQDGKQSRLGSAWYDESEDLTPEYSLVLWNDEKHTVTEVEDQVARACSQKKSFGRRRANEANDYGRSVVEHSKDIEHLLKVATIIEQIKITVTIRSSRDTFREQMCGTIVEWLNDIAGCSVGPDHQILNRTVCEQLLKPWRLGSTGSNKYVGKNGLDDHELEERVQPSFVRRHHIIPTFVPRLAREDSDTDSATNDAGEDDENEYEDDMQLSNRGDGAGTDQMDLDIVAVTHENISGDQEMRTPNDMEDGAEISEATFAGYPPPPPPPPPPPLQQHNRDSSIGSQISAPFANISFAPFASKTNIPIPTTSKLPRKKMRPRPPGYWLEQPDQNTSLDSMPVEEDLLRRVRLDWLLLYDLRLWKKVRIDLRDLYITTLIATRETKRIFGLRFAGLYSVLGQLYLIADREPDLSIINLSVQTFTAPSVTKEAIERGNFLTTLLSMLYTFLTQRTVLQPWEVSVDDSMAQENNSVHNRRMYHFFLDLKHMFSAEYVQNELRTQERYQLQFLDLIRLPQGICPNTRAVGEHVEYENDIWISAQILTKEVNKLVRQFSEIFRPQESATDHENLYRILRLVAKAVVINSMGAERVRFDQAEIRHETRFKDLEHYYFERTADPLGSHLVVDFVIEREAISFHHPLHYMLSWLIDCGKSMPLEQLKKLLTFSLHELREPPPYKALVTDQDSDDYLMAAFDFPLRVCAWLAQMKAGMWVRNGLSLRHQMTTYRGLAHRDLAHHRDIFLLQTALVVCNPSRVLASMVDRFGVDQWMRGNYSIRDGFESSQQLDVAEDFVHLLIVLLSDRTALQPSKNAESSRAAVIRRDIAHILCFKPLSFSELDQRFADKSTDLEFFQEILDEMTTFKPPEGLADTGTFELKPKHLLEIDPYAAHYNKNQRDEAENAYRNWFSKQYGKPASEVVYEPRFTPISDGIFKHLAHFTRSPLFAQIIFHSLFVSSNAHNMPDIPGTRIEAYLHVVLHLILIAVIEEPPRERRDFSLEQRIGKSFITNALEIRSELGLTIFDLLVKMLELSELRLCHPQIRLVLQRIRQRQPETFESAASHIIGELSAENLGVESPMTPGEDEQEARQREAQRLKKQQALDRQAKVMAQFQQQQQKFLDNQDISAWDEEEGSVTGASLDDETQVWRFPSGNCILCQEETTDARLYGTFGLIMNSNVFRDTDVRDADILAEVLKLPDSLDHSAGGLRPFGVAGSNRNKVVKRSADGNEAVKDNQSLARGFPAAFSTRGPVSTGCGHIMHYSCFEMYCNATQRRQNHQIARQHPERTDLKEFVCPLCKALGNAFLPIIWKGKEEVPNTVLQCTGTFEDWLSSGVGLAVSRFFKTQEGRSDSDRLEDLSTIYVSQNMVPSVSSNVFSLSQASSSSLASAQISSESWFSSMPGRWQSNLESIRSPDRATAVDMTQANELMTVYSRLKDTMKANKLPTRFDLHSEPLLGQTSELSSADTLARILGESVTSAEIAQRGLQCDYGQILVDKMPGSVLTHLRIFAETVSSYMALGVKATGASNTSAAEVSETTRLQLFQLFGGHPQIENDSIGVLQPNVPSVLSQDPFVLLVECTYTLMPAFSIEFGHLLRLCYTLELVKVALYLATSPATFERCYQKNEGDVDTSFSNAQYAALQRSLRQLYSYSIPNMPAYFGQNQTWENTLGLPESPQWYAILFKAVSRYALAFLRKAAILAHVRYGVDFLDSNLDISESGTSELDRLTALLHLPSIEEILDSMNSNESPTILQNVIEGWLAHWRHQQNEKAMKDHPPPFAEAHPAFAQAVYETMRPRHPAIYELIGLPKHFDTLTYEATRRRCPTKGNKLEDPNLCLFCGDIFCGQALCCTKQGKGGCFQHMQKCGVDVGLFLNIRKCTILYLHNQNGSWSLAPYLDKFGEPDPALRRGRQLSLNQKRYDKLLRDVWLQQGIPTMIARKLEAEINNGGWETL